MKTLIALLPFTFFAGTALAAPNSYQVTGQVLELNDKAIVISKGNDNWELQRNAQTRLPADVKVGSRVTIEYTITAVDVTNKTPPGKTKKKESSTSATKATEAKTATDKDKTKK